MRRGHHRREPLDAFGDRAVDVALAEGLAGRAEYHHLVGPRSQRRLQALEVGRQHRVAHVAAARDVSHHLRVVGHLRHPLGADEAGDLDLAQPRRLQAMHELHLVRRGHRLLLVLQTVAWPHVDDAHSRRNHEKSPVQMGSFNW